MRAYPNYDTYYALVWGRELVHGQLPSYGAFAAPTPHPLFSVLAAFAGVVAGDDAERVMVAICGVADALLAYGVYRLGRAMSTPVVGAIAAVLVASSPVFLEYVARGYVDVPFLAAVIWAAVLVCERPEKPGAAMALLGVAGLLRPEAWILAGLLWLRHSRRSGSWQPRLLAGALVAPALWALSDLAVTGDPLHSLHSTAALAETLGRPRGLGAVPARFLAFVGNTVRPPVLIAGLAGAFLAWRWRDRMRSLDVVGGLFVSGTAAFVVFGVAGVSILPRYAALPAIVICLLAALVLAGWTLLLPAGRRHAVAISGAFVVVAAGAIGYATARSDEMVELAREVRYLTGVRDDLRAILEQSPVVRARRCGPLSLPTYRELPDARWYLHAERDEVVSRADPGEAARAQRAGVALVARGENVQTIGSVSGLPSGTNAAPAGFKKVAENETFAAYVRCPRLDGDATRG